jgi:hypothetical protein
MIKLDSLPISLVTTWHDHITLIRQMMAEYPKSQDFSLATKTLVNEGKVGPDNFSSTK